MLFATTLAAVLPLAPFQEPAALLDQTAEGPYRIELHFRTGASALTSTELAQAPLLAHWIERATGAEVRIEGGAASVLLETEPALLEANLTALGTCLTATSPAPGNLLGTWLAEEDAIARAVDAALSRGDVHLADAVDAEQLSSCAARLFPRGGLMVAIQGPAETAALGNIAQRVRAAAADGAPTLERVTAPIREETALAFVPRAAAVMAELRASVRLGDLDAGERAELRRAAAALTEHGNVVYSLEEGVGGTLLAAEARVSTGLARSTLASMLTHLRSRPFPEFESPEPTPFESSVASTWDEWVAAPPDAATDLSPASPGMQVVVVGAPELAGVLRGLGEVATVDLPSPTRAELPPAAERMLAAVGGREAWARVRALHIKIRIQNGPQQIDTEQWVEIGAPRQRVRISVGEQTFTQALDGDRGWEERDGNVRQFTSQEIEARIQQKRRGLWEILRAVSLAERMEVREAGGGLTLVGEAGLAVQVDLNDEGFPERLRYLAPDGTPRLFEYQNWRTQSGVGYASLITEKNSGSTWTVMQFELLERVEPSLLDPPR